MIILAQSNCTFQLLGPEVSGKLSPPATGSAGLANTQIRNLYLWFQGIFGSTLCPNYDVYWYSLYSGSSRDYLGSLSFYGSQPRGGQNPKGLSQKITIPSHLSQMMASELSSLGSLSLTLKSQEMSLHTYSVVIDRVYLCHAD